MKLTRIAGLLVFAVLASAALAAPGDGAGPGAFPESSVYPAMEFARADGQSLFLDLFVPSGRGPFPVIVSVHGGSWASGTRDQGLAILQLDRGYAVANMDYRLAPASTWPAQVEDAKAAVRWLRANSGRFALDPGRIGVMGLSAGGHIGAVLGTSHGVTALEGIELGNGGYSSEVQAVVDYFGPSDLLKLKQQALPCMPGDPNDPAEAPSQLLGCTLPLCPEKAATANPITYVTPDDPPFLLLHGTSDCLVPWQQSQILHDALRKAGVRSKLIVIPFATHGDPLFLAPPIQQQVNEFLDEHLKGPRERRRPMRRN
ncbi:MAG: alpha/beta hydrolase [Thermoanaerobaculia bacterium]|nr:alpha/beta hydrolase [Thermoanaerobaculia bacterium]